MTTSADNDDLIREIAWGIKHDAFDDPVSRSALRAFNHGVCDDVVAGILIGRVKQVQRQEALGELNPFRKPRLFRGGLVLGIEGIRIPLQYLVEHLWIIGNSGSGKTCLLLWLLLQIAAGGHAIWVSDNYKKQVRHLRFLLQRLGRELVILGARDWKFNLLECSGDPGTHLKMVVDILCRLLDLPPRSRSILRQVCHDQYRKHGVFEGCSDSFPTLFHAYESIRATRGLNEAAREAILDRLGALLTALTPKCAAYRVGWKAIDLAHHSIVFEMQGATELVKQVLLEPCLFSLFQHEIDRGVVNGRLNLCIAFEDSQRFFGRQTGYEITPMDELAGIIRGSGKSLCVVTQTAIGLSRQLIPNLGTKIFGRLGCHEDYEILGADLGLSSQQREWARLHLKPGMFIGQVASGDWREPFLFNAPLVSTPSVIDDQDATESVKALDSLRTVPAPEFAHWEPHGVIEVAQPTGTALSETEIRYLKAVIANPGKPSSFYSSAAGISGRRAAEIRRRLVQDEYLREHTVATGQRGRSSIVLQPLEPAFKAAGGAS